jgi:hypothetical protein
MSAGSQGETSRDTGMNRRLDPPAVFVLDPGLGLHPFTGRRPEIPRIGIMLHGSEKSKEKVKKMIDASSKSRYNISEPNG